MTPPAQIFRRLMRSAPFQPATNLWRAVELDAVQQYGLPAGRALDLGCGDGKLTRVLLDAMAGAAPVNEWVGVDIDPEETAQARSGGLYRRVHTGSAATIAEPDASFDLVFSNSVLEHIGPIEAVLAEAARLLKTGGRFICTVPGPDFHACLRGPRSSSTTRADYEREIDTRCAHLRYWDVPTWQRQFDACGLALSHHGAYLGERQTQRWERLSAVTGGLAYRLYGRRARPIEIQRRLRLRNERPGVLGVLGAAASGWLAAGCSLAADAPDRRFGCLLLDAVKR